MGEVEVAEDRLNGRGAGEEGEGLHLSPARWTLNGAKILREEEDIGSVEPGQLADMVVIEGAPLS